MNVSIDELDLLFKNRHELLSYFTLVPYDLIEYTLAIIQGEINLFNRWKEKSGYVLYDNYLSSQSINIDIPSYAVPYLTHLKKVYICCKENNGLPDNIFRLTNIETLSIQSNNLFCLPSGISNLVKLKSLVCYDNILTTLPNSLYSLTTLENLHLSSNRLTCISSNISKLTNLVFLTCHNNDITSLPCLTSLTKLIELYSDITMQDRAIQDFINEKLCYEENITISFNDVYTKFSSWCSSEHVACKKIGKIVFRKQCENIIGKFTRKDGKYFLIDTNFI